MVKSKIVVVFFPIEDRLLWSATLSNRTQQTMMHFRKGTALKFSVSAAWEPIIEFL